MGNRELSLAEFADSLIATWEILAENLHQLSSLTDTLIEVLHDIRTHAQTLDFELSKLTIPDFQAPPQQNPGPAPDPTTATRGLSRYGLAGLQ
ncbi:Uncharacterised protein [Mycobacteroides abscessus subsp. bolletii]|uniref:hypothetical protein n=1 Tax=Mycobacteroides abscessus TaxID=36809 RepID=UPI000929414E|nr:hypothetical protein [Mycobacteroides abscessus]SIJ06244.1 Uncharacterised protein [Mycobacteroides abscessus subsp. bolletii]SLD78716.1 Uncharacterised protein [Mycobacteroides abscessus subsp. bolletii]SLD85937.1 Uncharacterised protein [Mycobacteroides abscessus subsp. bolletii]